MDPLSLGLGAGSAIIGGIGSLFGASSSNKTNLKIARETNEMNYKIWQEQKKHNVDMFNRENQAAIDMWNMQNEYNDPSAVAARLSAAGINPATMAGNSGLGMSSSAPDVGSAQPASAPQMQMPAPVTSPFMAAWDSAMQGINVVSQALLNQHQAMNLDANTGKTKSETVAQDIINQYLPEQQQWLTEGSKQIAEQRKKQNKLLDLDIKYGESERILKLQQLDSVIAYNDAQRRYLSIDTKNKEILNKYLDGDQQLNLMMKMRQYGLMFLDGKIKLQTVKNMAQELLLTSAQTKVAEATAAGLTLDNVGKEFDANFIKLFSDELVEQQLGEICAGIAENSARETEAFTRELRARAEQFTEKFNLRRNRNNYNDYYEEGLFNWISGGRAGDFLDTVDQGLEYSGRQVGNIVGLRSLFK